MKLSLLISSILVTVTANSGYDEVNQLISDFSSKVISNFDKIVTDAKDLTTTGVTRTGDVVAGITSEIELETEAFENEMKEIISQGEIQEDCALEELIQSSVAMNDAIEKVKACNSENTKVLTSFEESIVTSVSTLKKSLGDLIELVKECKDDKSCVNAKINASKELFMDTIDKFENAIEQARAQVANIIESTKDCALNILQALIQQQQEIGEKIKSCN